MSRVSLDALDDEVFGAMNDVGFPVARVLEGIDAAAHAGLFPVKVNMVVKRGVNDHCILPMADYFRDGPQILRFIEYMDVGTTNRWSLGDVVTAAEIHRMIDARWPLEPLAADYPGEVATRYRYRDGVGQIGLITSVTQPFCGELHSCPAFRGRQAYTCLFAGCGHDLRAERAAEPPTARPAHALDLVRPGGPLLRDTRDPERSRGEDRDVLHRRLMPRPALIAKRASPLDQSRGGGLPGGRDL